MKGDSYDRYQSIKTDLTTIVEEVITTANVGENDLLSLVVQQVKSWAA